MKKRVTLKDVARVAGVSVGTASMALNDNQLVNEETRKRVLEVATRLEYVPNEIARRLQAQRTNTIAVVIPHTASHVFSHPYFNGIFLGITEVLEKHGMTLNISTSPKETDEQSAYQKILRNRSADGVIVASAAATDKNAFKLAQSGYPVVFIGEFIDSGITSVAVDDYGGAFQATEHLIKEHKFTRIAHITGPLHHSSAQLRYEGFVYALRKNQLELRASDVYEGDYSQDAGYIGMKKLLSLDDYPKAVFVGNDLMSVGALQALGEANLRVPQDIAIVSFDDVYLAQLTSPPLTTVRQPIKELGKYAAEILINRLTDTNDQNTDIVPTQGLQHKLETKLIIRRSCGCMGGGT